jgi:hypothetical protein
MHSWYGKLPDGPATEIAVFAKPFDRVDQHVDIWISERARGLYSFGRKNGLNIAQASSDCPRALDVQIESPSTDPIEK